MNAIRKMEVKAVLKAGELYKEKTEYLFSVME